jgi:hypothetical protein
MISDAGKELIASSLSVRKILNIAIGTGTPAANALGTEISRKAVDTTTVSSNTLTFISQWDVEDNVSGTITEVGLFETSPSGNMFSAKSITPVVKDFRDYLAITYLITV